MNTKKFLLRSAVAAAILVASQAGAGGLGAGLGGGVGGALSGTVSGIGGTGGWTRPGQIDGAVDGGLSSASTAGIESSRRAARSRGAVDATNSAAGAARGTAAIPARDHAADKKTPSPAAGTAAPQQKRGLVGGTELSGALDGTASATRGAEPATPAGTEPQPSRTVNGAIQNSTSASGSAGAHGQQASTGDSGLAVDAAGSSTTSAMMSGT